MVKEQSAAETQQLMIGQSQRGPQIILHGNDGKAKATLEPLALQAIDGSTIEGQWTGIQQDEGSLNAEGVLTHESGTIRSMLQVLIPREDNPEPFTLNWRVSFERGPCTGAIIHRVMLQSIEADPTLLDLPSVHYGRNSYGKGLFPHPDPRRGFSFRADRLAQPAIHYSAPEATWSYFAANEAPLTPEADLVYSLGIVPSGDGLNLFFRYPQTEFGHRGDGSPDAYIAKDTFAPGENAVAAWQSSTTLEKTLFLWCRSAAASHDYGAPARVLWRRAYSAERSRGSSSLWKQVGEHISWFNTRLYNPNAGGGQYESPEGSGTAMLGFVEQSLSMASTTLTYAALCRSNQSRYPSINGLWKRAEDALTRWATQGRSPEGLLYPACDSGGYFFGYRNYADYEKLSIVRDEGLDSLREASEARALLSAANSKRVSGQASSQVRLWEDAALGVANWLKRHVLPSGGVASRYRRTGEPIDPYPGGTAAAISLFCDCARLLAGVSDAESHQYASAAITAYESTLGPLARQGIFAAGTLDASAPDREAAIAVLDACLQLYDLTRDERYLLDARLAADNILSYTLVYNISTFGTGTDATRQTISTFGASIVSPENQHLDPVPTAPGLILYGLYTNDEVCIQAGIESMKWALDGRWAIREDAGLKQSEQLLHTRWYYNAFFSSRGDYRRGMPILGRTDSEHGWPQVVPSAAFLGTGQVLVDWQTGRVAAVDGWHIAESVIGDVLTLHLVTDISSSTGGIELFLKVVRLPDVRKLTLTVNGEAMQVSRDQLSHGFLLSLSQASSTTLTIQEH